MDVFALEAERRCGAAVEDQAELVALDPLRLDPTQRLDADDIVGHVEVDVFAEPHLEGVRRLIGVAADRDEPALRPLGGGRRAGADAPGPAGLPKGVPKLGAAGAVLEVDLEAALLGPARTLHGNRDARDVCLAEPEILELPHPVAQHVRHHVLGLGTLQRHRRNIGLAHRDVQPALGGDSAGP